LLIQNCTILLSFDYVTQVFGMLSLPLVATNPLTIWSILTLGLFRAFCVSIFDVADELHCVFLYFDVSEWPPSSARC
jgi:hypothetical protein